MLWLLSRPVLMLVFTYGLPYQDAYGAVDDVDEADFSAGEELLYEADVDCEGPAIGAEASHFGRALAEGFG